MNKFDFWWGFICVIVLEALLFSEKYISETLIEILFLAIATLMLAFAIYFGFKKRWNFISGVIVGLIVAAVTFPFFMGLLFID